jgi:hypothetical protein
MCRCKPHCHMEGMLLSRGLLGRPTSLAQPGVSIQPPGGVCITSPACSGVNLLLSATNTPQLTASCCTHLNPPWLPRPPCSGSSWEVSQGKGQ